jgi:hypothetical protein
LTRRLDFKGLQLKIIGLHGQPLRLLLELHLVPVSGTASDSFHTDTGSRQGGHRSRAA